MPQKPSFARTLITNWHAILIQLYIIGEGAWLIIYPDLNPANPHVLGGIQAVAVFLIGYAAVHWLHIATTQPVATTPMSDRPTRQVQAVDPSQTTYRNPGTPPPLMG